MVQVMAVELTTTASLPYPVRLNSMFLLLGLNSLGQPAGNTPGIKKVNGGADKIFEPLRINQSGIRVGVHFTESLL